MGAEHMPHRAIARQVQHNTVRAHTFFYRWCNEWQGPYFELSLTSRSALCHSEAPCHLYLEAAETTSFEDGVAKPFSKSVPFPAFLGGSGGASVVGDVGESVLVEAKIWLVKAP